MPDDNRFSGIGDALEGGEDDSPTDQADSEPTSDSGATSEASSESAQSTTDTASSNDPQQPAFEFSETTQTPIYVRSETLEEFQKAVKLDVERALIEDHDVANSTKSEIHDAMLRLAVEQPERVAELLAEARTTEG